MSDPQDPQDSEVPSEPRSPWRGRLGVRVVIGVMLVAGMIYGWSAMGRQKARKQAEAMEAVTLAGGRVYLDYQWKEGRAVSDGQPQQARWLRRLVGPEFFDRVVAVDLREVERPDELMSWLGLMPYVVDLNVSGTDLGDRELEVIGRFKGLKRLDLAGTAVTDQGVLQLDRLTQLLALSLASTDVTDRSLAVVGRMKRLKRLDLSGTPVSDVAGLGRTLPHCRIEGP